VGNGEGLRMGRDVANNTRALREYLRRVAGDRYGVRPLLSDRVDMKE
jgi:hypothetical protein